MPYKDRAKQLAAQKKHYQENKASYAARSRKTMNKRRKELKAITDEIKGSTPCQDCGIKYHPYVMEFAHNGDKVDGVSRMVNSGIALERIMTEIAKCDIVCANCHRIRHIIDANC